MQPSKEKLEQLSRHIKEKNKITDEISLLIGRPAEKGHVGEYIASNIFNIQLENSASNKGSDGNFTHGALAGKSVNIKFSTKHDGLLSINPEALPDYYLVLTGEKTAAISSRGMTRPWVIKSVFLFDTVELLGILETRGAKINEATSVINALWHKAQIYPEQNNPLLILTSEQKELLALFS